MSLEGGHPLPSAVLVPAGRPTLRRYMPGTPVSACTQSPHQSVLHLEQSVKGNNSLFI